MPSVLLLVIGSLLWIAVSVLAVALCRVAGQRQYAPRPDSTAGTVAHEDLEVACRRPARDVVVGPCVLPNPTP